MQSPDIKEAMTMEDYKIAINFANGERKIFDLKPYLNYNVFKPLIDIEKFKDFKIEDGTIEWSCGADLSQDTFYIEGTPAENVESAML